MTDLIEFDVGNDRTVFIEVDRVTTSGEVTPCTRNPGEIAAKAGQTFSEALANIKPMIQAVRTQLDDAAEAATAMEVKFSVKLSGEVGAVITKVGGEATYEITMRWEKP